MTGKVSMLLDYVIRDGFIIDGADRNSLPLKADIGVKGKRIVEIGNIPVSAGERIISAKGLFISPGFIDSHAHSEFTLLADGRAEAKILQGVTTEINGNCGLSAAPLFGAALAQREKEFEELDIRERWNTFPEYFALLNKKRFATNFITLAGHGNLRASAAGYMDKPVSKSQLEEMTGLLREAMNAGAKGLSTGLIYPPGTYSEIFELVHLAGEAARHSGIYTTHMRSEGDMLLEAIDEAISIARESGIHLHISHLKTSGEKNWWKIEEIFKRINYAQENNIALTCDRYPYTAAGTDLDSILPSWAFEGGREKEISRLRTERQRLAGDITTEHPDTSYWDSVMISSVTRGNNKWMEGRVVSDISSSVGKSATELLFDLLVEEELQVGAIFFSMNEDNLKAVLKQPYTVIGSDSSARSFDGITAKGSPHPRAFGCFPRVLGRYVREQNILTLSEAVYKMTGFTSKIFSIKDRGIIAKGYFADITIFDPDKVIDTAEFSDPFKKPEGIHYVFVNGVPVVFEGSATGALPGKILR